MDNQIVCPNCGAPNESTSTSCHFCGASLTRARAKANQQEAPENENSSSKVSVKEVKGKPQIKFDKRIFNLNYDEFKDEAELYLSYDIVSLENKFRNYDYNFNLNRLWLGRIKTIISDGLRYDFYDSISITTDNLDLLETFCNLNLKDCRISEVSEGKEILFVLVCRAFYNTIFDHSKYTDAADKLYGYYLQSDEYKRKVEKEKLKKEREKREKEEEEGTTFDGILGLLFLYIVFSIIGGTIHCFCSDKGWFEAVFLWIKFPYTVIMWIWNLFS